MTDATDTDGLAFWMLGPLTATRSGVELSLGGRQQRAVLACLLIEAGHPVTRSRLSDELWGEHLPRGAATTIQTYVSHLRDVLEPGRDQHERPSVLVTGNGGYRLEVDPSRIDSLVFRRRVDHGRALLRSGEAQAAAAAAVELRSALSTWRDDALSDLLEYRCAEAESTRLHELRLVAAEALADAELRLGHDAGVIETVLPLVAANPLREHLHEQLMLALYRSGRQSEALEVHRRLAARLAEELGADPGPAVESLHLAILRHDGELDAAPGPVQPPAASVVVAGTGGGTAVGSTREAQWTRALTAAGRPGVRSRPRPTVAVRASRVRLRALVGIVAVVVALVGAVTTQPWDWPDAPDPPVALAANAVSELDEAGAVLASVPVGTNPIALAAGRGAAWVINAGDDTVSKIDPTTHTVQRVLDVGHDPQAMAVTDDDLWVANFGDGTVSRINLVGAKVVETIHVGSGPAAVAAGPAGLWVANSGDNTIQRIDTTTGTAHAPVDVGDGPDGLAVDATSIWVANGRAGSVTRVDGRTGEQISAPIRVGSGPRDIVRAGGDVWVADELSQSVTRINVATQHAHSIDVGDGPTSVAVHRGAVWVAERYSGDLYRIDPGTEQKTRVDARGAVRGLALVNGHIWVSSGAAASAAHRGGTLRVAAEALPGQISGLDPPNAYDRTAWHVDRTVYDGLLAYHYASADPQVLVPDLATSVPEPTDGGRTYTFNIRPGIRYSTGGLVKATDLVRGVRRALLSTAGRPDFYAGIVGGQACIDDSSACDLRKGVVADDVERRVTFHLNAPDPLFLHKLTFMVVPAPPGTPLRTLTSPLPGTGPYRITSFAQGKRLSLARNKFFHEWSAGAQPDGFLDSITWAKVDTVREAVHAVTEGRADLAELTPLGGWTPALGSLVEGLRIRAPSRVHGSLVQGTIFGVLNSARPPFDKLGARRAFNYAVDRTKVVRLLGGPSVAVEACQLIPPGVPSYAPYCPYTTGPADGDYRGPDLDKARQLVRASGTYGTKVTVTDVVGDYNPPLDSYFTHVLRRLGYRVTLRRIPDTPHNERLYLDPRSGIQVESGGWYADFPVPTNFYELVSCAGAGYPTGHCNQALDRRAAVATSMLQSDPGAALRTWTRINREVTDQAALVPVTNDVNWWVTSERVGNYQRGGLDIGPLMSQLWVR